MEVSSTVAALSRVLREARMRTELSPTQVAEKVGVHFVTVYAWENERRPNQPTEANLSRIARAYGTTSVALRRRASEIEKTLGQDNATQGVAEEHTADVSVAEQPHKNRRSGPQQLLRGGRSITGPATNAPGDASHDLIKPARGSAAIDLNDPQTSSRPVTYPPVTVLPRGVYSRVLRVLADIADDVSLTPASIAAAQQALTAPAFFDVFAAFASPPLSEDDMNAAIDAAGAAVKLFINRRAMSTRNQPRRDTHRHAPT